MANALSRQFKILNDDFRSLELDYKSHKEEFARRGKLHAENNEAMRDFASLSNKLMTKVEYLESKEAKHDDAISKLIDNLTSIKVMIRTAIIMGGAFGSFFMFFCSKILNWW